ALRGMVRPQEPRRGQREHGRNAETIPAVERPPTTVAGLAKNHPDHGDGTNQGQSDGTLEQDSAGRRDGTHETPGVDAAAGMSLEKGQERCGYGASQRYVDSGRAGDRREVDRGSEHDGANRRGPGTAFASQEKEHHPNGKEPG